MGEQPQVPDYDGACVANVVPALLGDPDAVPGWVPSGAGAAEQVVLLVLDGLGWEQLVERRSLAPTLLSLEGGAISTVAPSTTATALTSIVTGETPGEHGIVGYRMDVGGEVLNVLRWSTPDGDARSVHPPEELQTVSAFCGHRPPVVTRAEFADSGFTRAHLAGVRFHGYRTLATLITKVRRLVRSGESFVYAYYDGLDKVAHEYGLDEHYESELAAIDSVVDTIISSLPSGAALLVTSDHGQVDVGQRLISLAPEVVDEMALQSGEGRFRWLHAKAGHEKDLLEAAIAHHSDHAWVRSVDEVLVEGWFGPKLTDAARARLGDVAVVARDDVAFLDSADTGPYDLIGRHGSLTSAEMQVPLLGSP